MQQTFDSMDTDFLGRYQRLEQVGAGSGGTVWRARDVATGQTVAVKQILTPTAQARARARRELTALKLLRLPGVVAFLDSAEEEDHFLLVTEFVEGTPFPGDGPGTWDRLRPLIIQLLQTLQQVHASGILHRDLKPANVLVDYQGTVKILDFGIAKGSVIGHTITRSQALMGTPHYMAPEQLSHGSVDARSDLYAVGMMIYEALTGSYPFEASDLWALLELRKKQNPPPILSVVPDIPPIGARLVDTLLARAPQSRFASAYDALIHLETLAPRRKLPYLGDQLVLTTLYEQAIQGKSQSFWGASGMGKTRTLEELATRLRTVGKDVLLLPSGDRLFSSLNNLSLDTPLSPDRAHQLLQARLKAGTVVLVDQGCDRWTTQLCTKLSGQGVVVMVQQNADLVLKALGALDVLPLFSGFSVIWHIPEDSTRLLLENSLGIPKAIAHCIDTWLAAGLVCWEQDQLALDRLALERIELGFWMRPLPPAPEDLDLPLKEVLSWLTLAGEASLETLGKVSNLSDFELEIYTEELFVKGLIDRRENGLMEPLRSVYTWDDTHRERAHSKLAENLPHGVQRFIQLTAAGKNRQITEEALWLSQEWILNGYAQRAHLALEIGLSHINDQETSELEALCLAMTQAALLVGDFATLKSSRLRLKRIQLPIARQLERLLEAMELITLGKVTDGARLIESMPPFSPPELDAYRAQILVRAELRTDKDAAARRVELLTSQPDPDGFWERRRKEWLGQIRFLQHRVPEAMALYASVAEAEPREHSRISALINVGISLRDSGRLSDALPFFFEAQASAARTRLPRLEAHAWVGIRNTRYRLEEALRPDHQLAAAIALLRDISLGCAAYQIEATIAWRSREYDKARELASYIPANSDNMRITQLSLLIASHDPSSLTEASALLARLPPSWLLLQSTALIAEYQPRLWQSPNVLQALRTLNPHDTQRQYILAPHEVYTAYHRHHPH